MSDDTKKATAKCPPQADVAIAALSGIDSVVNEHQRHLLDPEGCEVCKNTLTQVLGFGCPTPLTLAHFANPDFYPETSAFGNTLREHVKTCDAQLCMKVAAALEADESQ